MQSPDYIPRVESEFSPWSENYVTVVSAKGAEWGVTEGEKTKIVALRDVYRQKHETAINPATSTIAATQAKNDAKNDFIAYIRKIYRMRILNNDDVTNEDRDLLQVPIRDRTHTPIPPPHSAPLLVVDTAKHLQHKFKAVDAVDGTKRGGLPAKVRGVEMWRKIDGTQPVNDTEFACFTTSTTATFIENYPLGSAGKTVWYRCRWVNSRNQPGPWSEIVSAIIP